jgi:hypothetical protein
MAAFHDYYKQLLGAKYHTPNLVSGREAWRDLVSAAMHGFRKARAGRHEALSRGLSGIQIQI